MKESKTTADLALLDDADFVEGLIKHLARSKEVFDTAKAVGLKSEDFEGIQIYEQFVDIITTINEAPIDSSLFILNVKKRLESNKLPVSQQESIGQLVSFMYSGELNPEYYSQYVQSFIDRKRYLKLSVRKDIGTLTALQQALAKINFSSASGKPEENTKVYSPFCQVYERSELLGVLPTGFRQIDEVAFGISKQEYGLILGHSGGGKTTLATSIAHANAILGNKVLYLSLEENGENITNRFYAKHFKLEYSKLYRRDPSELMLLKQKFGEMSSIEDKFLIDSLRVADIRELCPMSCEAIKRYLDKFVETEKFIPDMVIIDQMDFLEPNNTDQDAEWNKYKVITIECNLLANHKLLGEHTFGLWVIHQAGGKMARTFTNNEITGFKGIIRPCVMCIGVGRDNPKSDLACIFSLKVRHAKNFEFDYVADFAKMSFGQDEQEIALVRQMQISKQQKNEKSKPRSNPTAAPAIKPISKLPPVNGQSSIFLHAGAK